MKFSKLTILLFIGIMPIFCSAQSTDTTMIVNGVCEMCQKTIEKAAMIKGVETVHWSPETKVLQVTYDGNKTSLKDISKAINKAGYDTEFDTAPEWAYEKLHNCCKYRDPQVIEAHEEKKK